MITKEALQQKYATLSTDKLMEIIDNKFDYTETAVTVAIQELATRNVSEEDIKNYKEKKIEKLDIFIKRNIIDDLNLFQKNLFFFIWIPIAMAALKQNFIDDGYLLKLKQANYYSWSGFISFMLSVTVPIYFGILFPTIITITLWIACFVPIYLLDEFFNRRRVIARLRKLFNQYEKNNELTDSIEEL